MSPCVLSMRFPVCTYGGVVWYFFVLDLCVTFFSCIVMMSGCV